MKTLHAVALALCLLGFAGTTRADEETSKKLIGTWVLDKSTGDLPAGSTVEFTKDGKLNVVVKDASGDLKLNGTYKVEKDKITVKLKVNDQDIEETVTIKKLTDDVLEVEDNENKVGTFKKKK
jgi:uncharacterized protein (TIGR03066 family)